MGKKAKPPPPPDMSRFTNRQMAISSQLESMGREMFDWAQGQQTQLGQLLEQYTGFSMPAMQEQADWARTMRNRYENQVRPQVDSLFAEAEQYASKGEEDRQRAAAAQDVQNAMQRERESQLRRLEGFGIDPSQTRYMALDKQAGLQEAALSALAQNQAAERTKQIGRDLRREAIDVGTGFLGEAAQGYNQAANIGISGLNAATAMTGAGAAAGQSALPFYQGAGSATGSAAGIVDSSYGREIDYADARNRAQSNLGGLGSLAGFGANFIPGIGPAISAGMGMLSGKPEGDNSARRTGGFAEGGAVMAPGGPTDDAGNINVSNGEYVIPADVVMKLGTNHFDKLIEKESGRPAPAAKMALPGAA